MAGRWDEEMSEAEKLKCEAVHRASMAARSAADAKYREGDPRWLQQYRLSYSLELMKGVFSVAQ